jgi:hypothetical protein
MRLLFAKNAAAQQAHARDRAIDRKNRGSTRFVVDELAKAVSRIRPARDADRWAAPWVRRLPL